MPQYRDDGQDSDSDAIDAHQLQAEDLVRKMAEDYKCGAKDGLKEVLERYKHMIWVYVQQFSNLQWCHGNSNRELEDILIATFLQAYKSANPKKIVGKSDPEGYLQAWLKNIAKRKCLDEIRRRRRSEGVFEVLNPNHGSHKPKKDNLPETERKWVIKLRRAFGKLDTRSKQILMYYYGPVDGSIEIFNQIPVKGCDDKALAEAWVIKPDSLRKLKQRALSRLETLINLESLE